VIIRHQTKETVQKVLSSKKITEPDPNQKLTTDNLALKDYVYDAGTTTTLHEIAK